MTELTFTVRGLPVPQGALVRSPSGGLYHRRRSELEAWRDAIATEARAAIGDRRALAGPVRVELAFVLRRPKGHYLPANRSRPEPVLRLDAPVWVAGPADLDKLCRAALDALTGVVLDDDGQVAQLVATKRYQDPDAPGVRIIVRPVEATR